MADSSHDKHVKAKLARALDLFDANWGKPFDAKVPETRVAALMPAMKGLPLDAIDFAIDAALATLDKHPVGAQLRKLAQASPTYTALMLAKRPHDDAPQPDRCDECHEQRAQWRYRYSDDLPRPLVASIIRHRTACSQYEKVQLPFVDPPLYGVKLDGETWGRDREVEPALPADAYEKGPGGELQRKSAARDYRAAAAGDV